MRSIATQLENTEAASTDDKVKEAIKTEIGTLCNRIKGDKFNPKGKDELATLISNLLEAHKNDLSDEQKRLLGMLASLESSRASSKSGAKDAIKDAIKSAVAILGDVSSLVGSILKYTTQNKGGTASIVGNLIGLGLNLWNLTEDNVGAFGKGANGKSNNANDAREKRDAKVDACRNAIISMASLPKLDAGKLRECRAQKKQPDAQELKSAEQHAAVFNIIESANVEMQDILLAIKTGFGAETRGENAPKKTMAERMDTTAQNLSFSNLEV